MQPEHNIYYSNKRGPPPFFHLDTNPVLAHVLVHSVDKTHCLVVTMELIWLFFSIFSFNFVPTPNKSLRFTRFKKLFKSPCHRSKQPLSKLHCFFARCALFKVTTFLFLQLFVPNDSAFA